jgi:hypothetical protein
MMRFRHYDDAAIIAAAMPLLLMPLILKLPTLMTYCCQHYATP